MNLKFQKIKSSDEQEEFFAFSKIVYAKNKYYRSTDDEIIELLIKGPSAFHAHASILPYLIKVKDNTVARLAFIHDKRMKEYVQVAFFEAIDDIHGLAQAIRTEARYLFPGIPKICIGLNGHLNYGAGLLKFPIDKPPLFGLPYSHDYYPDYFGGFQEHKLISFKFTLNGVSEYLSRIEGRLLSQKIRVRPINKSNLKREIEIYTSLNNRCFENHPFWSDRESGEDYEIFHLFYDLLENENILFAEIDGKPIAFLLWFADFNQLLSSDRPLRTSSFFSMDKLRYKFFNPVDTFRFAEIGILPEYQNKRIAFHLINRMLQAVIKKGFKYGEGGFIFEQNTKSINLALRYIERVTGEKVSKFREYAVFEDNFG